MKCRIYCYLIHFGPFQSIGSVGLRAQITYWALTENWAIWGRVNGNGWFKPKTQWAKYKWEDGLRRNISLDMINRSHLHVVMIMMTFQEAPMIKMCIMNVQGWWDLRNILESCCHRIECTVTTFLAAFMLRRPLKSVALTTTTHRKPERVSNGIGTQVKA